MRTSFATKSSSRQHAPIDTDRGFKGKTPSLETCVPIPPISSETRRKTLKDCQKVIIAYVRTHSDCRPADLIAIAEHKGITVTGSGLRYWLSKWREEDSAIPKLKRGRKPTLDQKTTHALIRGFKKNPQWTVDDAVGFCAKHGKLIKPGTLQMQLVQLRKTDQTIPHLKSEPTGILADCKKAIITYVRVHPEYHAIDLVRVASYNGVQTTSNTIWGGLYYWRKKDPTIPKPKHGNCKFTKDCKEAIIAYMKAHPECHTIDLIRIASKNGVQTTSNHIRSQLSKWRKEDPTIPKLKGGPIRKRVSVIYPIKEALVSALKQHPEWTINDAVGFCRKHRKGITPENLRIQLRKMRIEDPTIPTLKPRPMPGTIAQNKDGTRTLSGARTEIKDFIAEKKEGCTMDELLCFVHILGIKTERNGLKVRLSQWRHAGDDIPHLK